MSHKSFNILPSVVDDQANVDPNQSSKSNKTKEKKNGEYLLKYMLAVNFLEYLEAGAVPALLIQLKQSFHMSPGIVFEIMTFVI